MNSEESSTSLAERLRRAREKQAGIQPEREEQPTNFKELYALRARILGVLIRDARQSRNRTVEDCAASLGVEVQTMLEWEYGLAHPALPQLELLAYELGVPVSHFWANETLSGDQPPHPLPQVEYVTLRNRVVGVLLRQARENMNLSLEELSASTGLSPEQIQDYELGNKPIPLTELTSLASATHVSMAYFLESHSRIGHWLDRQESFRRFNKMPEDIQAFISNPSNSSFVELAMWFSMLGVQDLRGIAESILHLSRLPSDRLQEIAEGILNNITL